MNCTLWCAAYLLGVSSETLIAEIGHDGKTVLWEEYSDQRRLRGISLPEIQTCFWMRNKMLAPIFLYPILAPEHGAKPFHLWSIEQASKRCASLLAGRRAIVIGQLPSGILHAIIWDENMYVDCRGGPTGMPSDFTPQEAYIICQL